MQNRNVEDTLRCRSPQSCKETVISPFAVGWRPAELASDPFFESRANDLATAVPKSKVTPNPPAKALRRPRFDSVIDPGAEHRLALVIGPAGAGKTTLLAQLASSVESLVAWYRAETSDRGLPRFVPVLEQALAIGRVAVRIGVACLVETCTPWCGHRRKPRSNGWWSMPRRHSGSSSRRGASRR